MPEALTVAAACIAFALIHSLMVAERTKRATAAAIGEPLVRRYYRLSFTLISIASTLAVAYVIYITPDIHIWSAPLWLAITMNMARALALVFAVRSFRGFDLAEFMGVAQAARAEDTGDIEGMTSSARLIRDGGYAVVRNPLYFAGIALVSLAPTITRNGLVVTAIADAYFIFGALIEERRMLARFGCEYLSYKKDVPLLLPNPLKILRFLLSPGR